MLLLIGVLIFGIFFIFIVLAAVLGVVIGGTVYTGLALVGVAKMFIPAIIAAVLLALLPIGKKKYLRRLPVCLCLCIIAEVICLIVWTHVPVDPTAGLPNDVAKVTAKVMAMHTMYGRPSNQPLSTAKYYLTDLDAGDWIPGQTYSIDLDRPDLTDDYWYTELSVLLTIDGYGCTVDITDAIPEALPHPDDNLP